MQCLSNGNTQTFRSNSPTIFIHTPSFHLHIFLCLARCQLYPSTTFQQEPLRCCPQVDGGVLPAFQNLHEALWQLRGAPLERSADRPPAPAYAAAAAAAEAPPAAIVALEAELRGTQAEVRQREVDLRRLQAEHGVETQTLEKVCSGRSPWFSGFVGLGRFPALLTPPFHHYSFQSLKPSPNPAASQA